MVTNRPYFRCAPDGLVNDILSFKPEGKLSGLTKAELVAFHPPKASPTSKPDAGCALTGPVLSSSTRRYVEVT